MEGREGEGKASLPGVLLLDVLNSAATFDTPDCKAGCISEAADDTGLPFQGALERFVEFHGVVEADDVHVAVCCTDDE